MARAHGGWCPEQPYRSEAAPVEIAGGINKDDKIKVTGGFRKLGRKLLAGDDLYVWEEPRGLEMLRSVPPKAVVGSQRIAVSDDQCSHRCTLLKDGALRPAPRLADRSAERAAPSLPPRAWNNLGTGHRRG